MADRKRELENAQKKLDALKRNYVGDVADALDNLEQANLRLYQAIKDARDVGVTFRELRDATNRSHEFFRSFQLRWAKRVKPAKKR